MRRVLLVTAPGRDHSALRAAANRCGIAVTELRYWEQIDRIMLDGIGGGSIQIDGRAEPEFERILFLDYPRFLHRQRHDPDDLRFAQSEWTATLQGWLWTNRSRLQNGSMLLFDIAKQQLPVIFERSFREAGLEVGPSVTDDHVWLVMRRDGAATYPHPARLNSILAPEAHDRLLWETVYRYDLSYVVARLDVGSRFRVTNSYIIPSEALPGEILGELCGL